MAYRRLVASKDVLCLLAPLFVIGVAFGRRLWRIGAPSVSGDEVNSLFFATRPLPELVAALATNEPHPPFYYLFLGGWIAAAGQSELALRLPSALFGTLGVAAGYAAGRVIGGPRAGLGTAMLLALSQFSILHAQDARMYAVLQAFVALYLAGLVRLIRRPDRVAWLVVALAGAGAAYTHYHGLLVVALGAAVLAVITPPAGWAVRLTPYL